jgi:hypothetical protein
VWQVKVLQAAGVKVEGKFVHGLTHTPDGSLGNETETYGDMWQLDFYEAYSNLTIKTKYFFAATINRYPDVKWIIKVCRTSAPTSHLSISICVAQVDDDVYLNINRLPAAIKQWDAMKSGEL